MLVRDDMYATVTPHSWVKSLLEFKLTYSFDFRTFSSIL